MKLSSDYPLLWAHNLWYWHFRQGERTCFFFLVPVFRAHRISPRPKERFTFNDKYYFGSFITVAPNNAHMLTSRTINKEFMADDKNWHKQINVINPFYGYVFAFFPVTTRKHIEKTTKKTLTEKVFFLRRELSLKKIKSKIKNNAHF